MAWPCSSDRFGPYDIQAHLSSAFQGDELKKQVALVKAIAEFLLDSQIPAFVSCHSPPLAAFEDHAQLQYYSSLN